MSAILELQVYGLQRQVLETVNDEAGTAALEHFFEATRKFKSNEEDILRYATNLVRATSDLMVEVEQGQHAHDWISSISRDLTAALAKREFMIDSVKVAAYLVEKTTDVELANSLRTAVFG